jgi:hypothetical protein
MKLIRARKRKTVLGRVTMICGSDDQSRPITSKEQLKGDIQIGSWHTKHGIVRYITNLLVVNRDFLTENYLEEAVNREKTFEVEGRG